jgi:hypothetical protein
MTYSQRNALVEGAVGVGATYTYSLTGLYDPDISGVGVQPTPFDQWSAMYNRFRVIRTRVHVEVNSAMTGGDSVMVGCSPGATTALPSQTGAWPSVPNSKFKLLGASYGAGSRAVFDFVVRPAKFLSLTRGQYMNDMDYSCSPLANPTRQLYLNIWAVGSGVTGSANFLTYLVYEVELSEFVGLNRS